MSSDRSYVEQVAIAAPSKCINLINCTLKTLRLGSALHKWTRRSPMSAGLQAKGLAGDTASYVQDKAAAVRPLICIA